MNLAVCVPISWDFVPTPFLISFTGLFRPAELKAMREQGITRYFHLFNRAFPLDLNRNQMVEKALELSADWLLFLDADMTFPAGLVSRLLAAAQESQAHLVSACYFKREPPHPCVSGRLEDPEDPQLITPLQGEDKGLLECDVIGLGAALVHNSVFTKVPCPWFEYEVYQKTGERVVTEDVPFCRKAKALGETILTDTRLLCGHVRQVEVGEEDGLKYRENIASED
jgi:glycosyltransferase involved in cell wall biosynthesis